jgi:RNA polymerase-interacting CarD/CdnL/TRCF family regulator
MKVIGKNDEGFIVEMSEDEAYNLTGYYSRYSDDKKKIQVGDEITIHEMYQQLYKLEWNRKDIKEAQNKLRKAADNLETVVPVITKITGKE